MTIRITTSARSGLGHALALVLITVPLVLLGLYLATGDLTAGDTLRMQSILKSLSAAKWVQQAGHGFSTALSDHFKKFGRVELIVDYGVAILAAFLLQGAVGRFIRSYRFRFHLGRKGVERQEMWLYIQVWALAWIVVGGALWLILGGVRGLIWGALVPAALMTPAWFLKREWLMRELFVPGFRKRVPMGRIKRMEVVASAEGGAALVVTFRGDWTWTIARGSPKRLQRVGSAVGRVTGLARRDLVTWG